MSSATRYLLALLIAAAIYTGAAAAAAGRLESASASCLRARIGGRLECLTAGLACRSRYEYLYLLYGYTCNRDADGRHRLRDRLYIGPPVPAPDSG